MSQNLILGIGTFGIFLGVFVRTMLPYWKKLREDVSLKFDVLYLKTAIVSGIVSFVVTMGLIMTWVPPNAPILIVFASGFNAGFTANSLINEVVS